MKDYFSKKYRTSRLYLENFRSKAVVRMFNLAKRLDQSHSKDETRKKKQSN